MTYKGKYQRASNSGKKSPTALRILLTAFTTVFCVALIALAIWMIHVGKARSDFRELSEMVQEKAAETVASVPTTFPAAEPAPEAAPTQPLPEEPVMLAKYASLYEQNHDLFGWLRIDGTAIDYPVMHTPSDPERYLHANFAREYSYGGVPFIDAACSADSDNLLIYGHNMLDGSMFRALMQYQEKSFWQSHPTVSFDTLYEQGEYEVLAAFYDRVYYQYEDCFKFYQFIDAQDEADFDDAISNFRAKALYDTGVTAAYGDRLITLVTCAYQVEDGRFVVVARKK